MLTAAALTAVAVQSCSRDSGADDARVPIVFSRSIVETKGATPLTTGGMTSFGLYAAYTAQGQFDADAATFNNIVNGKFIESQGKWMGQTDYYWPVSGLLTFVAYAPYSAQGGGIAGLTVPEAQAGTGFPVFTYTPPTGGAELSAMPDLCLSTPLIDRSKPLNGDVETPLEFHHVLTGVSFYGRYTVNYTNDTFDQDYAVKLHSISLSGLIGTKWVKASATAPYFEWQPDGSLPQSATYTLRREDGQVASDAIDNVSSQLFNPGNGHLFLLPQTSSNAKLTISYGVYLKSTDVLLATFSTSAIALPAIEWESGDQLDYQLGAVLNLNTNQFETTLTCATTAPVFYNWLQSGR